jgi:amino acid adenylation domain-containing protein
MEFDPILVHEWLRRTARRLPTKTAVVCGNQRWTFGQIDEASDRLARAWMASGMKRHDRVAIFLNNSIEVVISLYASLKAGGTFAVLDPAIKPPKLRAILEEMAPFALVSGGTQTEIVREALGTSFRVALIVWVGGDRREERSAPETSVTWEEIAIGEPLEQGQGSAGDFPRCIDVDLACLVYTSGSRGRPKGIMCSHHNVISACRSIIQYLGNREEDVVMCVIPLSFDYGLYQVLMSIMYGGTVVLVPGLVYLYPILGLIGKERVTGFPIVPSILEMLLSLKTLKDFDFSSLRYMTNTGAALPERNIRLLRSALPHVAVYSMFGLSECKRVSFLPPSQIDRLPGSVGRPMPNCEVLLLDESGQEVPPGDIGEMVVRGSNLMQGYWQDAQFTDAVYHTGSYPEDRRLYSGDLFSSDPEGNLFFRGRRDDMIKCRGERVSPREVELVIQQMEGIEEVAVKGIPDDFDGQAIVAFVVSAPGSRIEVEAVRAHCARFLEKARIPRHIRFLDRLPRTARGKIDRDRLVLGMEGKTQ